MAQTLTTALLVAALSPLSGCLLLQERPGTASSGCADDDLGMLVGRKGGHTLNGDAGRSRYLCPSALPGDADVVFSWLAPRTASYEFTVHADDDDVHIGVSAPRCGGELDACGPSTTYDAVRGEPLHIVVQTDDDDVHDFAVQIKAIDDDGGGGGGGGGGGTTTGGPGASDEPCPYTNDGDCDEPSGTDLCDWGTDTNDCGEACPYKNDGLCDEPYLCPTGTDGNDCD